MREYRSRSPEETYQIGQELASLCKKGDVLLFYGSLGSGKTTLIRGLVHQITKSPYEVTSPTFVYLNLYEEAKGSDKKNSEGEGSSSLAATVCHFDLYRLNSEEEFYAHAFDEYLVEEAVVCIEWPERVPSLEGEGTLKVNLSHLPGDERYIEIIDLK